MNRKPNIEEKINQVRVENQHFGFTQNVLRLVARIQAIRIAVNSTVLLDVIVDKLKHSLITDKFVFVPIFEFTLAKIFSNIDSCSTMIKV